MAQAGVLSVAWVITTTIWVSLSVGATMAANVWMFMLMTPCLLAPGYAAITIDDNRVTLATPMVILGAGLGGHTNGRRTDLAI